MSVSNILYIHQEGLVLVHIGSKSSITYKSSKSDVNYNLLENEIKKLSNLIIVLNTQTEFSEHKTFTQNVKDHIIQDSIHARINKNDALCGNYNSLFHDNTKDSPNKKDQIITIISKNEQNKFIANVMAISLSAKTKIIGIYSYTQIIGFFGNIKGNNVNLSVIIHREGVYITALHGDKFIFGRKIKPRENEDNIVAMARGLAIITKYINTSFSFLNAKFNVQIYSTDNIEKDTIVGTDPVLNNIDITVNKIKLDQIIDNQNHDIDDINILINIAKEGKYKKIVKLTNTQIKQREVLFIFRQLLRITILTAIASSILVLFIQYGKIIASIRTKSITSDKLSSISTESIKLTSDLNKLGEMKYAPLVVKVSNTFNGYEAPTKLLQITGNALKDFTNQISVEGYHYSLKEISQYEYVHELRVEIAIYNQTGYIDDAEKLYTKINKSLTNSLSQYSEDVNITMQPLPKTKSLRPENFEVRTSITITESKVTKSK